MFLTLAQLKRALALLDAPDEAEVLVLGGQGDQYVTNVRVDREGDGTYVVMIETGYE